MAASTFYAGSSELVTVVHKDSAGVAIPHSTITEARYILKNDQGDTLLKYALSSPAGWKTLTADSAAGTFTFIIQEPDGKDWIKGKVFLETWIKITDSAMTEGFKPMNQVHIFNVSETNYSLQ